MTRDAFEAWMRLDSTLPLERDANSYADMTAALMWHAWQAAQKSAAPTMYAYIKTRAEAGNAEARNILESIND